MRSALLFTDIAGRHLLTTDGAWLPIGNRKHISIHDADLAVAPDMEKAKTVIREALSGDLHLRVIEVKIDDKGITSDIPRGPSKALKDEPRYVAMTMDKAKMILGKFAHDFKGMDFEAIRKTVEGALAIKLWTIAIAWGVEQGHAEELGIDPEFVKDLYSHA